MLCAKASLRSADNENVDLIGCGLRKGMMECSLWEGSAVLFDLAVCLHGSRILGCVVAEHEEDENRFGANIQGVVSMAFAEEDLCLCLRMTNELRRWYRLLLLVGRGCVVMLAVGMTIKGDTDDDDDELRGVAMVVALGASQEAAVVALVALVMLVAMLQSLERLPS